MNDESEQDQDQDQEPATALYLKELSKMWARPEAASAATSEAPLTCEESATSEAPVPSEAPGTCCRVCGDPSAYRKHYKVFCCEGCKKFFYNVLKGTTVTFECVNNKFECPVTALSRTDCKACRFAKCVAAGMKIGTLLYILNFILWF